jgi:CDP-ribitol ribitolphosphotransferase
MVIFLRAWTLRLASWACYVLPVRERVVLASNTSAELRGNLRYLHDEIVSRGNAPPVKLLLRASRGGLLGKLSSLWAGVVAEYYLATSSVFIVDDYYFPIYVAKRKRGTTVIQTWHASGAFKKVGYSVVGKGFGASEALVRRVDIHSNYDHCLIASATALPHYMEAFRQPAERFVSLGIPRNDLFGDLTAAGAAAGALYDDYALPRQKRVILYAPTFRGSSTHSAEYDDYLDLNLMCDRLSDTYIVLLRLHPAVAEETPVDPELEGFVFDVSDHPEMNELLLISDVLVTDYSSTIFDYSLLERPMVFFAPDLDQYESERGFYFDYLAGVPGPVCLTSEEVAGVIEASDWDVERVREFRRQSFDVADGRASARVVEELVLGR